MVRCNICSVCGKYGWPYIGKYLEVWTMCVDCANKELMRNRYLKAKIQVLEYAKFGEELWD